MDMDPGSSIFNCSHLNGGWRLSQSEDEKQLLTPKVNFTVTYSPCARLWMVAGFWSTQEKLKTQTSGTTSANRCPTVPPIDMDIYIIQIGLKKISSRMYLFLFEFYF